MLLAKQVTSYLQKEVVGLGKATSKKINEKYPSKFDLYLLLDNHGAENALDGLVPQHLFRAIDYVFSGLKKRANSIKWLRNIGLSEYSAGVVSGWSEDAKKIIEENPYALAAFIGFHKADKIALSLGLAKRDPRRIHSFVCYLVHSVTENGSTVIAFEDLEEKLKGYSDFFGLNWKAIVKQMVNDGIVIGRPINNKQYVQSVGHFRMEMLVEDRLKEFVRLPIKSNQSVKAIDECEEIIGLSLSQTQRKAVILSLFSRVAVISGGAGTGKTTLLKAIYHGVDGLSVVQLALTGKAALRMTQATAIPSKTIAAFLYEQEGKTIENALVVVDEASMLDIYTAYRLMNAIGGSCRVILVGDHFQLPPIAPGLVFHRLCETNLIPKVVLTEVHRQADVTGIPSLGEKIRQRTFDQLPCWNGELTGVYKVPCENRSINLETSSLFAEIAQHFGLEETQIIAATKNGNAGTYDINHLLSGRFGQKSCGSDFAEGDKILCTKNIYQLGVFNGLTGVCKGGAFSSDIGVLPIDDSIRNFLETGFAITVHKAQGSQWKAVIVAVRNSMILDLTMVYTALTRASELVIFVGDIEAIEQAVRRGPASNKRQVGFFNV